MHTAAIKRISTDAAGKYLLTSSKGKTAKLWDAESGDLLKTLRPPIGHGKEGMLYAATLSPNGQIAAVGGWTSKDDIYLFHTATGELFQRLSGLGNVIFDLEFSPDGNYLAAALGGTKGVVIFKIESRTTGTFSKYKTLSGYGGRSNNTAFASDNRLATVCYDGYIRLYDANFELQKKTSGAGNKPFSIAFSPDGSSLAVGYEDSPVIEVRSGYNLNLKYKPELDGMDKDGGFVNVSFSADGRYLYGGGYYQQYIDSNWWCVIRRWSEAGKGSYIDFKGGDNTITDLKAIPDNAPYEAGILMGGYKPDWARLSTSGVQKVYQTGELYSYRAKDRSHFKINTIGDGIAFTPLGKEGLEFSLSNRSLTGSGNVSDLSSYTDKHRGINISDWKNSYSPQINGQKVDFLKQYEFCRSTDITTDGSRVVLGTGWAIYCSDTDGEQIWKTSVQGAAWAVNVSGNGKVVAAALSGGTINWYDMRDGDLVLTLYVHPETRKWLLFTPGGYYDASPGAENYFGWHLNNGADKTAHFFPASKFRNKYYRPDVIDNILITLDEDDALRIANIAGNRKENRVKIENMLPPIVDIIEPYYNQEFSKSEITIKYRATSPGKESITNVRFMIDGRPVENLRGLKKLSTTQYYSKTITIPEKDVSIQVLAENTHGWSEPATVKIKWKGRKQEDILKPTLYVLAIGVSDYQNNDYDLKYAAKDARDFTDVMRNQKGGLYKDVVVKTLTDTKAQKNDILDGLDWIQSETTSRDMAMIFIAGHGINDNVGSFYYLPYEADIDRLRRTALIFTEFKYTAEAMAGKLVMFVDACHSGDVMGSRRAADVNLLVNELSDVEAGAVVFTSSTGKQYSLENAEWNNGAFTEALIEGMNGKADLFGKGRITVKTLDAYIADRVKELTGGKQSPTVVIPQSMPDFPIGVVK